MAHQYSRVDFYLSVEVNLGLYYGGVHTPIECSANYSLVNVNYLMHARAPPGMAGDGPSFTIRTLVPVVDF